MLFVSLKINNMKNTYKISVVVVLLLLVALLVIKDNSARSSISIGAVIPQTGFGSYWGLAVEKGIELAKSELEGKYGQGNVSIFIEDSQSSVPVAVTAAQKLFNVNKVNALYSEFSGPSNAISPVAKTANKAFVYSTFNQDIAKDNDQSIKTFISFEVACGKLGQFLNDRNKKVLIISAIGGAGLYCEKGLKSYLPTENIKLIEGFSGTDFRTILLQNKSFAPDFIIPIMYEDGSFALFKQKKELGFKSNLYCYRQDCVTKKVLSELPHEYTEGTMFFEVPIAESFVSKIKAKYPEVTVDDIQAAANSYQSILVLGEALADCPNSDSQCVTSKIANKRDLESTGYKNVSFVDRILQSDLVLGIVKGGEAVVE